MGQLRDEAEALGIEIDGRWSNGTLQRKISEVREIRAKEDLRSKVPSEPVAVRLRNNFKPAGWYEVVGHYDNEEVFHAGVPAPAPFPGVHFAHKLWAGTVVKIPKDEAKALVEHADEVTLIERDPVTKIARGSKLVKRRRPLAELFTDWSKPVAAAS